MHVKLPKKAVMVAAAAGLGLVAAGPAAAQAALASPAGGSSSGTVKVPCSTS